MDLEAIDWRWYERRGDMTLRVFYRYAGPPRRHICRVAVRESTDAVEIGLWMPDIDSKLAALRGCVDVPLRAPLGERDVIDSITGQPATDAGVLPPLREDEWDEHEWVRAAQRAGDCDHVTPEYLPADAGPRASA